MNRDDLIDREIGLTDILNHFSNSNNHKIIIIGDNKCGKSNALSSIKNKFSHSKSKPAFYELNTGHNVLLGINDYFPFIKLLDDKENIESANFKLKSKKFIDKFSQKASAVLELFSRNPYYSARYNDTEINILERMNNIVSDRANIFLCDDIDKWDYASKSLIYKLLSDENTEWANCSYFIFTASNRKEVDKQFEFYLSKKQIDIYELHTVSKKILGQYLSKYEIEISTELLYEYTGGNIGLISSLLELCTTDELVTQANLNQIVQINIENRIKRFSQDLAKNKKTVEMVNKSSIAGLGFHKNFLKKLVSLTNEDFTESYFYAKRADIYDENKSIVYFKSKNLWQILFDCNKDNLLYHQAYAEALKAIIPSNFELRAYEYLMSDNIQEAVEAYFTYAVEFMKKYHQRVLLSDNFYCYLEEYGFLGLLDSILKGYEYYFAEKYEDAKQALNSIECENLYINYQKNYLEVLIYINSTTLHSSYEDANLKLLRWVSDLNFKASEPYLWVQAATASLENNFELSHINETLLAEVNRVFECFLSVDKQFKIEYYNFKSKNNYTFSIDTEYQETRSAVEFFKKETGLPSQSLFIGALVNHLANALVMGYYDEVIDKTNENLPIFDMCQELKPFLPALLNNYIIAQIFSSPENLKEICESYIPIFKEIVKVRANCEITEALYNINFGLVCFFANDYASALKIYKDLYVKFACESDVDCYYRYFIINNYNIINNFINKENKNDFIDVLESINPLPNNKQYFVKRNEALRTFNTCNYEQSELFLPMGENILGKSWSFWGRPLLFSDVQFWTD